VLGGHDCFCFEFQALHLTQIVPLDGRFGLEFDFKDTNRVSRHAGKDKLMCRVNNTFILYYLD